MLCVCPRSSMKGDTSSLVKHRTRDPITAAKFYSAEQMANSVASCEKLVSLPVQNVTCPKWLIGKYASTLYSAVISLLTKISFDVFLTLLTNIDLAKKCFIGCTY